jgi:hypothetical protein
MPQFSYPFVDEVRITSFVNLEFEEESLIEMVKTIAQQINEKSNNFLHMFDKIVIEDIDLSETVDIKDVNIKVGPEGVSRTGFISSKEFL